MRLITALFLCCLCSASFAAQPPAQSAPPPPPVPIADDAAADEPQVTIIQKQNETVEEFRISGRLYMIKVTPKSGKPYYLVDDRGDGKFSRQESLDSGVRPPRWIIHRF